MVGTKPIEGMTGTDLVKMMLGKVVSESYIPTKGDRSEKILEVKNVRTRKLRDIQLRIIQRRNSWILWFGWRRKNRSS